MPVVVDELNDLVGHTYSGMPDRLYVIDRNGRVAYKGGRGPFGFKSREMEQALVMTLLDQPPAVASAAKPVAAKSVESPKTQKEAKATAKDGQAVKQSVPRK
jgi:hypothetical protein